MADRELTEELRAIESGSDGHTAIGVVTEIEKRGSDTIAVTVELPHGEEFTDYFDQPMPPTEDYAFTRIANEYGHGLTDIDALDGNTVDCGYNFLEKDDDWVIIDPAYRPPIDVRTFRISLGVSCSSQQHCGCWTLQSSRHMCW